MSILVIDLAGSAVPEDDQMTGFAAAVTTAMLSGIGLAVFVMCLMTVAALIHRGAMGGRKDGERQ